MAVVYIPLFALHSWPCGRHTAVPFAPVCMYRHVAAQWTMCGRVAGGREAQGESAENGGEEKRAEARGEDEPRMTEEVAVEEEASSLTDETIGGNTR